MSHLIPAALKVRPQRHPHRPFAGYNGRELS